MSVLYIHLINKEVIMDMVNDPAGYGLGLPWHWITGIIVVFLVVYIIFKLVQRKKKEKFDSR